MITFFAIPKPFEGHINLIQRNAIRSWTLLEPLCEVILFGDEPGAAAVAEEMYARHVADIQRNEYGTPLLSDVFAKAEKQANYPYLCYVNADIILMSDFIRAFLIATRAMGKFVLTGRRWNVDVTEPWAFHNPMWESLMRRYVLHAGELYTPLGMDYFVFPRGCGLAELPPFAVGRPGWDNWYLYHARRLGVPVIDGTSEIMAVHQNHGYGHVPMARDGTWMGPEGDRNLALIGGRTHHFGLKDATHMLADGKIHMRLDLESFRQRWRRLPVLAPRLAPVVLAISRAKAALSFR